MRLTRTGPGSTRMKLLSRDRYHCAFTSKVDIESLERGDVDLSAEPPRGLGGSYLVVARIVSRPLSSSSSSSDPLPASACSLARRAALTDCCAALLFDLRM